MNQCTNGAAPRRRHALGAVQKKLPSSSAAAAAAAHLSTLAQEVASRGRKVSAHTVSNLHAPRRTAIKIPSAACLSLNHSTGRFIECAKRERATKIHNAVYLRGRKIERSARVSECGIRALCTRHKDRAARVAIRK